MALIQITTKVYRCSDNRRYFTKLAAMRHEAWIKWKATNEPEGEEDDGTPFYTSEQMQEFVFFFNDFRGTKEGQPNAK